MPEVVVVGMLSLVDEDLKSRWLLPLSVCFTYCFTGNEKIQSVLMSVNAVTRGNQMDG